MLLQTKGNFMNKYVERLKRKALVYTFTGLSVFGGVNKLNAQNNNTQNINISQSSYVVHNAKYRAYRDNINVSYGNKNFSKSQHVMIREIGEGYSIMHELFSINNLGINDTKNIYRTMLTPDGRIINLDFYDTKDAISLSEALNNKKYSNAPIETMKNNNYKCEMELLKKAKKKLKNKEDRKAFAQYLKQEREFLETDVISSEITKELKVDGFTDKLFITSPISTDLRRTYKKLKKETKASIHDIRNNALSSDINLIKISHQKAR